MFPVAEHLIRKRKLHFPEQRRPGLKQKYPRVPVDLDQVRQKGAWVTGNDIAVTQKRWSKLPKKARERLMAAEPTGSEEMADPGCDGEKEDSNRLDDDNNYLLDQSGDKGDADDSMEEDENQERVSKRPRVRYSPMLGSSDSESSSADDADDSKYVLPPNIAQDMVVWLNSILLDTALAMPEVTGKALVKLKPASWMSLVDTVAMRGSGDLSVAFAAEARLTELYGAREQADDRQRTIIQRQTSLHVTKRHLVELERELCPDTFRKAYKPIGPPAPIVEKVRKKWTRRLGGNGTGTAKEASAPSTSVDSNGLDLAKTFSVVALEHDDRAGG